jgi:hypothetical protein
VLAGLVRRGEDFDAAEDALEEALLEAPGVDTGDSLPRRRDAPHPHMTPTRRRRQ